MYKITNISYMERRRRFKWPALNGNSKWEYLDEELDKVLEAILLGTAEKELEAMATSTSSF